MYSTICKLVSQAILAAIRAYRDQDAVPSRPAASSSAAAGWSLPAWSGGFPNVWRPENFEEWRKGLGEFCELPSRNEFGRKSHLHAPIEELEDFLAVQLLRIAHPFVVKGCVALATQRSHLDTVRIVGLNPGDSAALFSCQSSGADEENTEAANASARSAVWCLCIVANHAGCRQDRPRTARNNEPLSRVVPVMVSEQIKCTWRAGPAAAATVEAAAAAAGAARDRGQHAARDRDQHAARDRDQDAAAAAEETLLPPEPDAAKGGAARRQTHGDLGVKVTRTINMLVAPHAWRAFAGPTLLEKAHKVGATTLIEKVREAVIGMPVITDEAKEKLGLGREATPAVPLVPCCEFMFGERNGKNVFLDNADLRGTKGVADQGHEEGRFVYLVPIRRVTRDTALATAFGGGVTGMHASPIGAAVTGFNLGPAFVDMPLLDKSFAEPGTPAKPMLSLPTNLSTFCLLCILLHAVVAARGVLTQLGSDQVGHDFAGTPSTTFRLLLPSPPSEPFTPSSGHAAALLSRAAVRDVGREDAPAVLLPTAMYRLAGGPSRSLCL